MRHPGQRHGLAFAARLLDTPVTRLGLAGRVEGTTLLLLIGVAVPLKHLGGQPGMVSALGPVHGLAFVAYLVSVVDTVSGGGFTAREIARLAAVSLVPFGTFANDRFLARRERRAAARHASGTRP